MSYSAKLKGFYATTSFLALLSVNSAASAEAATIEQSVHKVVHINESETAQVHRDTGGGAPHSTFLAQARPNVTSVNYHPDVRLIHETVEPVVYRPAAAPVQQAIHRDLYQAHQEINRDVEQDTAQAHRQIDQQVDRARQQINWDAEAHRDWGYSGRPYWHDSGAGWGAALGLLDGLAIGESLASLPVHAQPIFVNGSSYYYANGAYFEPAGGVYRVVVPPLGAIVPALPAGYVTLYDSNSSPYYYFNGVFYRPGSEGYGVIAPPIGVTVPYLPKGATSVVINGIPYYRYAGVTYQPYYNAGTEVYAVVKL